MEGDPDSRDEQALREGDELRSRKEVLDRHLAERPSAPAPAPQADAVAPGGDAIARGVGDAPLPGRASPAGDAPAAGPPTILLVEDDQVTRKVTRKLLEGSGYAVLEAASGAEAMAVAAAEGRLDLVLTDLGLPDVGGDCMVQELRAQRPGLRVIYLSGRSPDEPEVQQALAEPDTAYLEKPIDVDELDLEIQRMLARAPA